MKGKPRIVNTAEDFQRSSISEEFIRKQAEQAVYKDVAEYPDDYDHNLKEGDEGFIEPVFVEEKFTDETLLKKFNLNI